MKTLRIGAVTAAAILILSSLPSARSAEVEYRSVEIIIKVKPDAIVMPEGAYKAPLAEIEISSDKIMELNRRFNLLSIEKMFARKKSKEELAEEFPERARRAPEAAEEPDPGDTFLLKFPEHTDVKELIDEYGNAEDVIYAEENVLMSIY